MNWTFTRAAAGNAFPLTNPLTFHCADSDPYRTWVAFVVSGTNNYGSVVPDTDLSVATRDFDLMNRYWKGPLLICGLHLRPNDDTGRKTAETTYDTGMATRYPSRFIDVHTYTLICGHVLNGLMPTVADITAMNQGSCRRRCCRWTRPTRRTTRGSRCGGGA